MYYAITIDSNGRITGRHESVIELTADVFARGAFAGQDVVPVAQGTQYQAGYLLAEYDADGALRPLIDRINDGLAQVPEGFELVDGQLVPTAVTPEEAPPRLLERVLGAEAKAEAFTIPAKAARVMFQALAKNDTITEADALDNKEMFDQWSDFIGKTAPAGIFLQYDGGLFRVQQEHPVQEHYPPSVHTAALYTRIQPTDAVEAWAQGQSYAKGVEVTHNGGVWLSGVDNNVWEPGAAGVFDNIWKRVRDA